MRNLRIVYMGTPEFAVAPLGSLLINGFNIAGVVTAPDKPAGRGRKTTISPVKRYALSAMLPLSQPENLKNDEFISWLKKLDADIFVVVGFRMLPEIVWKLPELGTINLHASLLPQYRGAAPINHVIINGETATGVTTFFIDDRIDTGKILQREEVQIFPCDNAGDLHDRLMKHGARLMVSTLAAIAEDRAEPRPQSDFQLPGEVLRIAPKIHAHDCIIDWNDDPEKIHRLIRGLSPSPSARFSIRNASSVKSVKLFESCPELKENDLIPGSLISDGKDYLKVSCKGGFINILSLQIEGRMRMSTPEFLRGFRISGYKAEVS
jgi:methionyl-tRNA formyltransferase